MLQLQGGAQFRKPPLEETPIGPDCSRKQCVILLFLTMLDFAVKDEKNLLDVLLRVQHCEGVRVLRAFARKLCENALWSLAFTTGVMAGSVGNALSSSTCSEVPGVLDNTMLRTEYRVTGCKKKTGTTSRNTLGVRLQATVSYLGPSLQFLFCGGFF